MASEILFRAWLKNEKTMRAVEKIDFKNKKVYCESYGMRYYDEIELTQFTGVKDKNGTKVFFGDICNGDGFLYEVVEFAGKAVLMSICKSYYMDLEKHNTYVEVIGNKFDNDLEVQDEQ